MTLTEAGRDAGALKRKGFVSRLDDELLSSCREGRWGSFLRAWFTAVVVMAVAGFAFPLIMCGAYLFVSTFVFGTSGKGGPDLLSLCAGIAALAGGTALIFTGPVMLAKAGQGGAPALLASTPAPLK